MNKGLSLFGIIVLSLVLVILFIAPAQADLYLNSKTGAIYFNTSGITRASIGSGGNFTINTSNFLVNTNLGRVGIGTTSPTHTLNIFGTFNTTGLSYFGANLSMGGLQINNLGTPSLSTDAATKAYVDSVTGGGGSTTWSLASGVVYLNNSLNNVSIGSTSSLFKLGVVGDIGITNGSLWQPVYPSDDGLVLYLPFSEGQGTTTYDKSPYRNDGALSNGNVTFGNGKYGNGLVFSPTNQTGAVRVPFSQSLNTSYITMSLWFMPAGNAGDGNVAPRLLMRGEDNLFRLALDNTETSASLTLNASGGYSTDVSVGSLSYNTWYYLVVTFNGSMIAMYLNGVLVDYNNTVSGSLSQSSSDLFIGNNAFTTGVRQINGSIDEVKVYNRALSADEIRTQYLSGMQSWLHFSRQIQNHKHNCLKDI